MNKTDNQQLTNNPNRLILFTFFCWKKT